MTIQIDIIRDDLEYIASLPVWNEHDHLDGKEEPQAWWCQGTFGVKTECGTAACLAGWHLLRKGYTLNKEPIPGGDINSTQVVWRSPDGRLIEPDEVTEKDYGITYVQGIDLFASGNSIEDMTDLVDQWAEEAA